MTTPPTSSSSEGEGGGPYHHRHHRPRRHFSHGHHLGNKTTVIVSFVMMVFVLSYSNLRVAVNDGVGGNANSSNRNGGDSSSSSSRDRNSQDRKESLLSSLNSNSESESDSVLAEADTATNDEVRASSSSTTMTSRRASSSSFSSSTIDAAAAATTSSLHQPRPSGSRRRRKVVLFGPHDRYNFGDLLFEKVLSRLLVQRAGYQDQDILRGGLVSVDMSSHDGHDNILSMKQIIRMSRRDAAAADGGGPYDIIYTGGESGGCNFARALKFIPDKRMKELAKSERVHDCGYLIPKRLLLLPEDDGGGDKKSSNRTKNYAIANSIGGSVIDVCREAIDTVDFATHRDRPPLLTPDSAVMTKELYKDHIEQIANERVLRDLRSLGNGTTTTTTTATVQEGRRENDGSNFDNIRYIAVQHKEFDSSRIVELARSLDEVSANMENITIVFFAAGTVPGHDSFDFYRQVQAEMRRPSVVYETEKTWDVVALISKAQAVLSTSLHVRIMSYIFFRPRVTWCLYGKHKNFIGLWDFRQSSGCVWTMNTTWPAMAKELVRAGIDSAGGGGGTDEMEIENYQRNVDKYLEMFDEWSSLLVAPDRE